MLDDSSRTFDAVQTAVIRLLSAQVFGTNGSVQEPAAWKKIFKEAEQQSVFAQVYSAAEPGLPAELKQGYATRFYQHVANNLRVIHAHGQVHKLFAEAGIPYVVLKGCASARFYPDPQLRAMGDVDIYVHRADLEKTDGLLNQAGYTGIDKDHPNHWCYRKDGIELELHWAVTGVPGTGNQEILAYLENLIETGMPDSVQGQAMQLPDAFHHGIVILLHTVSHLTAGGVGLRHLLDWVVVQNSMPEETFCKLFRGPLSTIGLWQFARALTAVGVRYFSAPERAYCAGVSESLTAELLADILEGGNFGHKDRDRLNQSKLLRNIETRKVDGKSSLHQTIVFLNQRARAVMPVTEKAPVLLPAGWAKVLIKRARNVRTGKQPKLRLKRTIQGAKARRSVYEQLRLFEKES